MTQPLDALVARTAGAQPGRRIFHGVNGLVIWGVLHLTGIETMTAAVLLAGMVAVALAIDLARLSHAPLNHLFFRLTPHLASPRERNRIASSTWYLVGMLGALLLVPRPYAEAGILVLALADPVASWFGRRYGRRPFGAGSVLGSTLFWCVALGALWPVAGLLPALLAATFVTLLEATPWPLDDNLVVPLGAAGGLWFAAGMLG